MSLQYLAITVAALILETALLLHAQWIPQARQVTATHGLTDNRVTALAQDSTGFIWIGTPYGLNRFDGFSVKTFVPSALPSISNEIINDIEADAKGNLWVATQGGGLNQLNLQTMNWKVIEKPFDEQHIGFINPVVWDVAADPDGTIWVANDGAFFVKYEPSKKDFTYFDFGSFMRQNIPASQATGYYAIQKCLRKDSSHWWLGFNKGLAMLNTHTGLFTLLGEGFDDNLTHMIWNEMHQKVFITLENGQVYSYHNPSGTFQQESVLPPSQSGGLFLPQKAPYSNLIASPKGLLQIDKNHPGVNKRPYAFFEKRVLDTMPVNCYLISQDQNIFVGTNEGLYYFNSGPIETNYFPLYPLQEGPNANGTTSVLAIDSLGLILTTVASPSSLFVISSMEGWVKQLTKDANGQPLSACLKVKAIGGDIWVLTSQNIYKYQVKDRKLTPWPPASRLKPGYFRDIEIDSDGKIWIAGFATGVWRWDPITAQWSAPTPPNKTGATALAWDKKAQRMWVGYFGRGLHSYHHNPKKNRVFNGDYIPGLKDNMNLVSDLVMGSDESLWVATNTGGLFRFTKNADDSIHFSQQHILSGSTSNQYMAITLGTNGQVLAMHNRGIIRTDTQFNEYALPLSISSFAFYSDPVWPHSMYFGSESKKLMVPVQGGILSIPTKDAIVNSFPIWIQAHLTNKNGIESDNNTNRSNLTLHYKHDVLEFFVSALYFGATPVHFEYKLNQDDNEWHPLPDMPYLRFDRLASGNYSLIIRANMPNGKTVAQSEVFYITVQAPFWKTWWFVLSIIFCMAIATALFIKKLQGKIVDEKKLNQFSTRLYGNHSLDDILWDATDSISQLLGFADCVIYELNAQQQMLVQRTASGPKRPYQIREIINPLEIPVGKGLTGAVALTGKPERIGNTKRDPRYIVDDAPRLSELAVPIWLDGTIFGVIDTEHPQKNFYTFHHQKLLEKMAAVMAERIKKFVTEEKLRNKIARDLHDDIGSTLTSISVISKVAQAQPDLPVKARQAMQQIHLRTSEVLENMSDIVWMINPANDDLAMLLDKMKEWLGEWAEPAGITHSFETNDNTVQFALNMEERKNCYLIFKEAVNNAVKYSACSHITVTVRLIDNNLKMRISDNGKGFDKQKTNHGNGLNNMQQRAKAIGATLQIISEISKGTSIELVKQVTLLG